MVNLEIVMNVKNFSVLFIFYGFPFNVLVLCISEYSTVPTLM